ncbi:TNT domain-containing protein [Kineosporia babensis]|uniref:TNT domain-containing protein n=1 Tax=Kineosporia babensis TaxID=499548 RepID=A0A9X1NMK4_9ACTN|nr:TNT domain-containing protein [Kineosporia babensis]
MLTPAAPAQAAASGVVQVAATTQVARVAVTTCSADFSEGDSRLGPKTLPNSGTVGWELKGYKRTGSLATAEFLAKYYDSTAKSWIYPPQNGYQLREDGTPITWRKKLKVGRELDRFGSEYGGFLSPAGTPYAERAIPPSNLAGTPAEACNYKRYRVVKEFDVSAGPIASWFEQRGDGWQYQLTGAYVSGAPGLLNVLWLVENGYLERVTS